MNDTDKKLEYLRGLEKLKASPIKAEDYTSVLDNDIMKVKSIPQPAAPDIVNRIKGATEHINTKQALPTISGSAFTDKINALRGLGKKAGRALPALGAITALGSGLMSGDASASEIASDVASELPSAIPVVGQVYDAARPETSGPATGSFDDRLERGQLTPEELEMLKNSFQGRE